MNNVNSSQVGKCVFCNDKLNLIFDIVILANAYDDTIKGKTKGGIYYENLNILNLLKNREDINLICYLNNDQFQKHHCQLERDFGVTNFLTYRPISLYSPYNFLIKKKSSYKFGNFIKNIVVRLLKFFIDKEINKIDAQYEFLSHKNKVAYLSCALKVPGIFQKQKKIRKFVMLQDVILYAFKEYEQDWFTRLVNSLNSEDTYFAISENTRKDFLHYFPVIKSENIFTTPISTSKLFKPQKSHDDLNNLKTKYGIPKNKKYILSLCQLNPRKNLLRNIQTFNIFIEKNKIDDLVFVLAGSLQHDTPKELKPYLKDRMRTSQFSDDNKNIYAIGFVDDDDVQCLFSNAEWFVYTSRYEGFGIPPLEAMCCGCPVIVSNNSSLPEVVGESGQLIDWDSDEQHIKAYEKYYFDSEYRNSMSQKGLERSKLFSWEKTVDNMMKIIKERTLTNE
jgi:glycosyltransferase involved in cell wall biosynthesis